MKSSSYSRRLASLCAFALGTTLLAGEAAAQSGGPDDWSGFYLGAEAGWANGYVAGAGLEYALTNRVVLGVGYSHVGLFINDQGMSCPACGVGVGLGTPDVDGDVNIDKVGARLTVRLR